MVIKMLADHLKHCEQLVQSTKRAYDRALESYEIASRAYNRYAKLEKDEEDNDDL